MTESERMNLIEKLNKDIDEKSLMILRVMGKYDERMEPVRKDGEGRS